MADWYTPTQVLRAFETTWKKIENSNFPLEEINEDDLINYYNNKKHNAKNLQDDLYFNTNKLYDSKVKKDSLRSQIEIHNNIYTEEIKKIVPIVTSHLYGHWLNNLEGRSLYNYKKVENKSDYRRSGIPLDMNNGLPKNTNDIFTD